MECPQCKGLGEIWFLVYCSQDYGPEYDVVSCPLCNCKGEVKEMTLTTSEYAEAFKKLPCKFCGKTDLMMMGDGAKVNGVFCRNCLEFEEISIEEIKERIDKNES